MNVILEGKRDFKMWWIEGFWLYLYFIRVVVFFIKLLGIVLVVIERVVDYIDLMEAELIVYLGRLMVIRLFCSFLRLFKITGRLKVIVVNLVGGAVDVKGGVLGSGRSRLIKSIYFISSLLVLCRFNWGF